MQQSVTAILSIIELFDNLTSVQLELIASICETGIFNEGDVLLEENENTTELYIIARGGVDILMNPSLVDVDHDKYEPVVITELRQGQVFGEIALVDEGIRSATARVSQDNTMILEIQRDRLMLLCDSYPELGYKFMKNVAADLAFKIRNTDLTVRQYQLMLTKTKQNKANL